MKFLFIIFLFFSCSLSENDSLSLNIENPYLGKEFQVFDNYNYVHNFKWNSSNSIKQVKYNRNGTIRVKYKDLQKGQKQRIDYNYGFLSFKAEVYQSLIEDTTLHYSYKNQEDSISIKSIFKDVFNGKYDEYNYNLFEDYYWSDTITNNQKEYYANEVMKINYEYSSLGKIRFDYNKDGILNRKSIVHQYFNNDTTWYIDSETLDDRQIINIGFVDYIDSVLFKKEYKPIISGQYKDGVKVGKWIGIKNEELVEIFHDKNGELDGKFKSYYYIEGVKGNLKKEGKYIYKRTTDIYNHGFISTTSITDSYTKIGQWKYYSPNGSLFKKVNH